MSGSVVNSPAVVPAVETQSSTHRSLLVPIDFYSARDSWARRGQQGGEPVEARDQVCVSEHGG